MNLKKITNKKFVIAMILLFFVIAVIAVASIIRMDEKKKKGVKSAGYYYINTQGDILNQYPVYLQGDMGEFNEDGLAFVKNLSTIEGYGDAIIDKNGNVLFDSKNICVSKKNIFPILIHKSDKIVILDENFCEIGQVKGNYNFKDIELRRGFSEGIAGLSVPIMGEMYFGYIDTSGEWIIAPKYKSGSAFNKEKNALVQDPESELFGIINDRGEWIVEPKFYDFDNFTEDGVARVCNPETKLWGYIDANGNQLNDDWYYGSSDFHGGYALVQKEKDGKAAYINTKGEYITDFIFDYKLSQKGFSEGLAYVKEYGGESYGYINEQGEYALEPHYFFANEFSCGLACVNDPVDGKDREVYIDKNGKIIIEDNGMVHYTFSPDGYAVVADARTHKYGMIDTKGEWLFKPQFVTEDRKIFSINSNFTNGCCVVYLEKGQIIKKPKK
ncbi:WG repeat-containing protein [Ruminococcus sp.]|uniref:WG repeat-containing protein n=1 Tax=Ruminococcus sp. TaxID=41978 RepID=UPI0025EEC719|nr:WG repeat-containing protein [Ruminococcus sp.]